MPYSRQDFVALLQRMQHGGPLNEIQANNVADEVEKLLREERREVAEHVSATADEDGMDIDSSLERLDGLLQAIYKGEDPSTYHRFHAPPYEDNF